MAELPTPTGDGRPGALRILVVDSNEGFAAALARVLALDGHQVEVTCDGDGALAAARARAPDVALLDLRLAGDGGGVVARRLRELPACARLRLVALSGIPEPSFSRLARAAGFDELLPKPVDLRRLRALLRSFLGGSREPEA